MAKSTIVPLETEDSKEVETIIDGARFLSAALDHGMLKKPQEFGDIKDSYVIFITERDVLKGDLPLYHLEREIVELESMVHDGNHIIYANGAYHDDSSAIGRLMHDFRCSNPEDMFYGILKEGVKYFKETEKGREKMSKDIEKYGDEREATGETKGKDKQARKTAENLARTGMDPQQIANALEYSVDEVEEWLGLQKV